MKVLIKTLYFFNKALGSIGQNPFVNIIAVGVITISFLIFSTFLMLSANLNSLLSLWEEDIQMEAFLRDNLPPDTIEAAKQKIITMEGIRSVTFISKDEALERFRNSMAGMGSLVEDLKDNPLPASFEIILQEEARGMDRVKATASELSRLEGVNDVIYGQEWVERFSTTLAIIRLIGLIIAAFLLMATIFIVSNTIKLTVYARKEELEITRLLGATNRFIKLPFLIEGMLQGLAGATLSLVILSGIYRLFVVKAASSLQGSLMTGAFPVTFLPASAIVYVLLGGMALGLFGSFISLGRFLKV